MPTSDTDERYRWEIPMRNTDERYRCEIPMRATDERYRSEVPTNDTDDRYRWDMPIRYRWEIPNWHTDESYRFDNAEILMSHRGGTDEMPMIRRSFLTRTLNKTLQEPFRHLIGTLVTFFILPPHRAESGNFIRLPPQASRTFNVFYTTSTRLPGRPPIVRKSHILYLKTHLLTQQHKFQL